MRKWVEASVQAPLLILWSEDSQQIGVIPIGRIREWRCDWDSSQIVIYTELNGEVHHIDFTEENDGGIAQSQLHEHLCKAFEGIQ